jgi:hypothetical protein
MTRLSEVTKYVRSKNAGPFWVTIDIFFKDHQTYCRYKNAGALSAAKIGSYYGVDAGKVRIFQVPTLDVMKISFPRLAPQGGLRERDMHSGQQYVRLLGLNLE